MLLIRESLCLNGDVSLFSIHRQVSIAVEEDLGLFPARIPATVLGSAVFVRRDPGGASILSWNRGAVILILHVPILSFKSTPSGLMQLSGGLLINYCTNFEQQCYQHRLVLGTFGGAQSHDLGMHLTPATPALVISVSW